MYVLSREFQVSRFAIQACTQYSSTLHPEFVRGLKSKILGLCLKFPNHLVAPQLEMYTGRYALFTTRRSQAKLLNYRKFQFYNTKLLSNFNHFSLIIRFESKHKNCRPMSQEYFGISCISIGAL